MNKQQFQSKVRQINFWLLMFLAFVLPISTSLISVTSVLIILCWVLEGDYRAKIQEIITNPLSKVVLFYIFLLLVGILWSDDFSANAYSIQKQWKMLLMPIFLTTVRMEKRWWIMWAFIAGVAAAMSSTYLAWLDLLRYADVTPEKLTRKSFHVVYNPMLAFAIYLALYQFIWGNLQRWVRLLVAIVAALMIVNMFMTDGRSGQLVFFVLMGLLFFQYLQTCAWKACLALVIVPFLFFFASYHMSAPFKDRVDLAVKEVRIYQVNPKTSVGLRLFFWTHSWKIYKQAPFLGVGTGGFEKAYKEVNKSFSPGMPVTDNPHNQYILSAVQLGFVGFASLMALFITQIWLAWKSKGSWGRLRFAFPVFFMVIMLTESYLLILETGVLFSLFCAVLYKGTESIKKGDAYTQDRQPSKCMRSACATQQEAVQ